ncbi:MAG: HD domain-containing protein [Candidatus Omnitrophica bacterium]|nr:HD domain-containing protein [Candidatus Omnitrophota bacterium]
MDNYQNIFQFVLEAGMLKRVRRSGWSVVGVPSAESVADHSFRCAVIGYVLARLENVHPYRVLLMTLFNDIHEARITDLHKLAQKYFDLPRAEDSCFAEQIEKLPPAMKDEFSCMRAEYCDQLSPESHIARDADILECLIQAKEYHEQGFQQAEKFMRKAPRYLHTESARRLWDTAGSMGCNDWWLSLSEFRR